MPSIQLFRRVVALTLFVSSISYSQVIIRERIAIDPKPGVQAQASSFANATLRYELQYDGPVSSPEQSFMRLQELVCGVFDSGPINSSLTVPAQSGLWNFSFRIHTPIVSNQYARFTVWLGEDVILKDSLLINCGSTCQINHQFGFRISNTFNLEANGQIFYSEQSFLNANAAGQQHCTTQMWHPGLPVNLRIVSGQELGQFADLNGNPLGHDVTVQGFNVGQITFLANGTEPDSISDFVTIEASSFGITRTATIEVLRVSESPIWLAMDAQGDVSHGAEMSILAQALNMFQQEVSAGTGVTYTFQIIEGSEWGTLFRGALEGNIISGVRPTDDFFSRGMATIGFRARKTEPAIPQRVTVRVSASNPDIHPGTYNFNVLPSPLAITVTPSTISYGQTATISVQKKYPDGTVSPWLQDAGFSYEIIKGHNAGYVLHPDTARRDDFFNGQSDTIQFVALEESPQPDTVEVQFYIYVFNEGGGIATAAFDPIQPSPTLRRTGLATVGVAKSSHKLSLTPEKMTLKALGDADNKANPNYNKNGPDKRRKITDYSKVMSTEVSVQVLDQNDNPIADYPFTLTALFRSSSGGHNHFPNRPSGRFIKNHDTLIVLVDTTDHTGAKKYKYLSSGIGGIDSLFVQGERPSDTASAIISICVDSLDELTDGDHYDLVGKTTIHPKNHYGSTNTIKILKMLADSAHADSSWTFQYNDMSLERGGPFDVSTDYPWDTPHQLHREGRHVDMRPVSTDQRAIDIKWLENKLKKHNWGSIDEENKGSTNHHFHLRID